MSDHLQTQLAKPGDDAVTRAKAARFLTRTGVTDLIEILGLGEVKPVRRGGNCVHCGNKLPGHGVCRRGKRCRESAEGRVAA
ncbi:hypothetical protein GCM10010172_04550 [Paractinoplanes ferrugineus]|uniref:Uncharacterized protein n=1 Tax=Paractinoplanes ferrugineus TaxID=113564 RepID=A0A919J964_9ACTN|nr:hypothetical protein [Actinoplanes ferrugineus]GIE16840.1 hypothetical protein Afe05nite_86800 [Actinoplanes ferrugineus]